MDYYKIIWKGSTEKDFRKIDKKYIKKIIETAESFAANPFPEGVRKLSGTESIFRVRIGPYRVVYQVFERIKMVVIHYIRHRKDAYKKR